MVLLHRNVRIRICRHVEKSSSHCELSEGGRREGCCELRDYSVVDDGLYRRERPLFGRLREVAQPIGWRNFQSFSVTHLTSTG